MIKWINNSKAEMQSYSKRKDPPPPKFDLKLYIMEINKWGGGVDTCMHNDDIGIRLNKGN